MKPSLRLLAAAISFVPTMANAQAISLTQRLTVPSPDLWYTERSRQFDCGGAFDRGVTAIRTGFVRDGLGCIQHSAAAGDIRSIRALGLMRLRGEYLTRDQEAAVSYFFEAALRGDAESMFLLGQCFTRGLGVAADQRLGQFWLNRAAANGYTPPAR